MEGQKPLQRDIIRPIGEIKATVERLCGQIELQNKLMTEGEIKRTDTEYKMSNLDELRDVIMELNANISILIKSNEQMSKLMQTATERMEHANKSMHDIASVILNNAIVEPRAEPHAETQSDMADEKSEKVEEKPQHQGVPKAEQIKWFFETSTPSNALDELKKKLIETCKNSKNLIEAINAGDDVKIKTELNKARSMNVSNIIAKIYSEFNSG